MKNALQNSTSAENQIIYDVIISGGGPVGLFLSCELALAGCSVLVLEKAAQQGSPLKRLPFGIRGLSAPTIEALSRRGLLSELAIHKHLKSPHQNANQGGRRQVGHFAGIPFYESDIDRSLWTYRLPGSTATSLISEMEELETVFSSRAVALGVDIKYGLPVIAFQQTPDGVTVQAGAPAAGTESSFKGKWLVGCDGSRSVVRKLGGFEFAGTEPTFTGYTTLMDIADPEKLKPGRNVTPAGMYLQSQPGYLMMQDFDNGAFHNTGKPVTLDHAQEVLRRISNTDVTVTTLHIGTTWTDRARQATAYRIGRVLLAGDAAHIHAPLGGQGLNLGLGDAVNLGWKLAQTIHGTAPEGLLNTYFTERHPTGIQVLDWSRAQAAAMNPSPDARALHSVLRDIINTKDGATYFAGRVWGINMHYDLKGDHPLTGYSVPAFEFESEEEDAGMDGLMHAGKAVLLDFNNDAALQKWTSAYGGQIQYIARTAKDRLGMSAILIRPDGITAWATDKDRVTDSDYTALENAAALWFVVSK